VEESYKSNLPKGIITYIYTQTARHTMNSYAPNDVHHPMNAVCLGYLYLSYKDVCNWSSDLNDAKTQRTSTKTMTLRQLSLCH